MQQAQSSTEQPSPSTSQQQALIKQQLESLLSIWSQYRQRKATPSPAALLSVFPSLLPSLSTLSQHAAYINDALLHQYIQTILHILESAADNAIITQLTAANNNSTTTFFSCIIYLLRLTQRWAVRITQLLLSLPTEHRSAAQQQVLEIAAASYVHCITVAEQWLTLYVTISSTALPLPSPIAAACVHILCFSMLQASPATQDAALTQLLHSLRQPAIAVACIQHLPIADTILTIAQIAQETHPHRQVEIAQVILNVWVVAATASMSPASSTPAAVPVYPVHESIMKLFHIIATRTNITSIATTTSTDPHASHLQSLHTLCMQFHNKCRSIPTLSSLSLLPLFALIGCLSSNTDSNTTTTAAPMISQSLSLSMHELSQTDLVSLPAGFLDLSTQCPLHVLALAPFSVMYAIACMYSVQYCVYDPSVFQHVLRVFGLVIDTRWIISGLETTTSSSSSSVSSIQHTKNQELFAWTHHPVFALIPVFCRALSLLYTQISPDDQWMMLIELWQRVRLIHCAWRWYNLQRVILIASTTRTAPPTNTVSSPSSQITEEEESAQQDDTEIEADSPHDHTLTHTNRALPSSTSLASSSLPVASIVLITLDQKMINVLQHTLFLSVCLLLATIVKQQNLTTTTSPSGTTAASTCCWMLDILSYLEFTRVNFSAYADVITSLVTQGLSNSAQPTVMAMKNKDRAPGEHTPHSTAVTQENLDNNKSSSSHRSWWCSLLPWNRSNPKSTTTTSSVLSGFPTSSNAGGASTDSSSVFSCIHHFLVHHLFDYLPAMPPDQLTIGALDHLFSSHTTTDTDHDDVEVALPFLPFSSSSSEYMVEADVVAMSRHFFVLGLLVSWQSKLSLQDTIQVVLPHAWTGLSVSIASVRKRAHTLFTHCCIHIVKAQPSLIQTTGYDLFLQLFPRYTALILELYPQTLSFGLLRDVLLILYHCLPNTHPLLAQTNLQIRDKLRDMMAPVLLLQPSQNNPAINTATSTTGNTSALVTDGNTESLSAVGLPTSVRHLLILYWQLVQIVDIASFPTILQQSNRLLFPDYQSTAVAPVDDGDADLSYDRVQALRVSVLTVTQQVISRNFDLYRRDLVVQWWLQQKEQLGVVFETAEQTQARMRRKKQQQQQSKPRAKL